MSNIDYSGIGSDVNRDPLTGIRYGIIPAHRIPWIWDIAQPVFPMECPHCGIDLQEPELDTLTLAQTRTIPSWEDGEICPLCCSDLEDGEQYADYPSHYDIGEDGDDTQGMVDTSGDAWCFISPYYTRARFCSPCAPGACYLASPDDNGARAYCFGPEFFDDSKPAPYPIWRVEDGALIYRPEHLIGE